MGRPTRMSVDLSAYPDMAVIYLGMRVEEPRGYATLERLGPQIHGGFEAMFVDTGTSIGLSSIAPAIPAEGPLMSARGRAEADRATAAR